MLSKAEKDYIIDLLNKGENLPEDFKYKLFPVEHKEYELAYAGKMRKEDLLANDDGSFPVPIQVEKTFNGKEHPGFEDGWKNMIVFGDNLQFLKTIYKNEDSVIKDRVKGKVKLIYIDPPFATSDEFQSKDGAKAYNDKKLGAEFLEFIRRRLVIAHQILADDGVMFIHLDQKMVHYVKIIADEVFGKNNFRNEIIWKYFGPTSSEQNFPRKHDVILFYSKSSNYYFDHSATFIDYDEKAIKRYDKIDENGRRYKIYYNDDGSERIAYMKDGKPTEVFNIPFVQGTSKERIGYPTQKPEKLISILLRAASQEGDIVMDFFGGSGTIAAVAEKLNRKWIVCDIGKLSYFTIQKRILQISMSKNIDNNRKYGKSARSFITCSLGTYDLKAALEMEFSKYKQFVSGLFDIDIKECKIGGYIFDGKKDDNPVVIFNYNLHKESNVDESFIEDISKQIGNRISGGRVYIVSPSTRVDFITDYQEVNDVRYYFLKIPYQIIKELHQKDFKKFRQPRSKININSLDESIGFSFNRTPSVKSNIITKDEDITIKIKEFSSGEPISTKSSEERKMSGFELLSAVFVDRSYNGKEFIMSDAYFSDELLEDNGELIITLNSKTVGKKIMVVYTDIYGNDFTECFSI